MKKDLFVRWLAMVAAVLIAQAVRGISALW